MPENKRIYSKFQYFLSFLFPVSLQKIQTNLQTLELSLENGELRINSENVNYSFGGNHQAWEDLLKSLSFPPDAKVLILGFGTGSIAHILHKLFGITNILGIEKDEVLVRWTQEFFRDKFPPSTKILRQDAFRFLRETSENFDYIFVDLFIDSLLPEALLQTKNIEEMLSRLRNNGIIVINSLFLDKNSRNQNLRMKEILQAFPDISLRSHYYKKHEFFILSK